MTSNQIRDQWSLGMFGGMLLGWATGFLPSLLSRSLTVTFVAHSASAFAALAVIGFGYSRLRVLRDDSGGTPSLPVAAIAIAISLATGVFALAPIILTRYGH